MARVDLAHHRGRLERRIGDLANGELLVAGLLGRDDRRVRGEYEVNPRVRHQVCLDITNQNKIRMKRPLINCELRHHQALLCDAFNQLANTELP